MKHPSIERIVLELHCAEGMKALTFYGDLDTISDDLQQTVLNLSKDKIKVLCRKENKDHRKHLWSKTITTAFSLDKTSKLLDHVGNKEHGN